MPTPPQFEYESLGSGGPFDGTVGMAFTKSMAKSKRKGKSERTDPPFVVRIEHVVSTGAQRRMSQAYALILRVAERVKESTK